MRRYEIMQLFCTCFFSTSPRYGIIIQSSGNPQNESMNFHKHVCDTDVIFIKINEFFGTLKKFIGSFVFSPPKIFGVLESDLEQM